MNDYPTGFVFISFNCRFGLLSLNFEVHFYPQYIKSSLSVKDIPGVNIFVEYKKDAYN